MFYLTLQTQTDIVIPRTAQLTDGSSFAGKLHLRHMDTGVEYVLQFDGGIVGDWYVGSRSPGLALERGMYYYALRDDYGNEMETGVMMVAQGSDSPAVPDIEINYKQYDTTD